MILKNLNRNLMNLEKKVLSMQGAGSGKGMFIKFIITDLSSCSKVSRHSYSPEFANLSTLYSFDRANEL